MWIALCALLVGALPAARAEASYRPATKKERRAMNKAHVKLEKRFGWFIGKQDPKFGYVCGYRTEAGVGSDAFVRGVGVRLSDGRWHTRKNPSSGELQTYDHNCSTLAGGRSSAMAATG